MSKQIDFIEKLGVRRQETVLQNGLRVILYERPNMPVALRAIFRSGSRYDPPGKEGLAHFVEHMIVAGTKSYPSKDLLAQFIEQYGGVFGAVTNSSTLGVDIQISEPEDLPKAAHLFDEMLNKSVLSQKVFETERGSVLRELGNRLSSPPQSLWYAYYGLFFQGSPIGRPVLGSKESINAIRLEDVRNFISDYLTLERMALFVVGGVSLADVEEAFGSLSLRSSSKHLKEIPPAPIVRDKTLDIREFKINDQIDFMIGFRACGFTNTDINALTVIRELLGGGRASVLTKKLRYEKGYIYSGGALNHASKNEGAWLFMTACSKKNFQEVLDIIASEIKRVHKGKITDKELGFVKEKIIKSLRITLQPTTSWVGHFSDFEAQAEGQTLNDYANGINDVTQEDLAQVGKKYFGPDSWYLAIAGDIKPNEFTVFGAK